MFFHKPTYPPNLTHSCLKRRSSPDYTSASEPSAQSFFLTSYRAPTILILALPMSSESPSSPSPPKTADNMRLPAYRASYLGRYHPYPRTRTPAREVVMVCTPRSDF